MDQHYGPPGPVTVFGAANIDRIGATFSSPVMGASNPGAARVTPGGVGFNIAVILARLGHPVRLVARIGADADGETVDAAARGAGVDMTHVTVSQTAPTATYLAALDEAGNLIIGIAGMDVHDEMTPAVVAAATADAPENDVWVVDANLPTDTLDFLVGEARATGHPIVALAVSPAKSVRLTPLLQDLTLLLVNRKEAAAILDRPDRGGRPAATDLARALAGRPHPDVIVTDADAPLAAACGGEVRSFAPRRAEAKSVNGAGDALAAGVIHGLASGRPLFEAIRPGLAAAAITMEHDGTVPPTLSAAALDARMDPGNGEEPT